MECGQDLLRAAGQLVTEIVLAPDTGGVEAESDEQPNERIAMTRFIATLVGARAGSTAAGRDDDRDGLAQDDDARLSAFVGILDVSVSQRLALAIEWNEVSQRVFRHHRPAIERVAAGLSRDDRLENRPLVELIYEGSAMDLD